MRVSNNMNYEQVKSNISRNRTEMADLQNQAATMKRITKPSDDPVGTARMLSLRTDKADTEQFMKNLDVAKSFLNYSDNALGEITELISRAKELAIYQSNDPSSSAVSRMATATEVDEMFNSLVNIGNRKFGERFIFAGYKTTQSPFDHLGNYHGDEGAIQLEVNKGVFTSINVPGNRVFLGAHEVLAKVPEDRRGSTTPNYPVPQDDIQKPIEIRGPASVREAQAEEQDEKRQKPNQGGPGENIFNVFRVLSDGLKANDTTSIQETLERLDTALEQVLLQRSQVGSRVATLETTQEGLSKNKIDDSALLSSTEDADAFEVFTDITKNENTLKATLQTSGKLIQPGLLDFLR